MARIRGACEPLQILSLSRARDDLSYIGKYVKAPARSFALGLSLYACLSLCCLIWAMTSGKISLICFTVFFFVGSFFFMDI